MRTRKVAIVSVIGANLRAPRLFAKAVSALADAEIPLIAAHAQGRGVDLQFVLPDDAYADAVRTLHKTLVEAEANPDQPCLIAA